MHDAEPLKPSNTGWLIADVVKHCFAYGWSRTEVDPELLALLDDPQWQPFVVFPGEYADQPERVVHELHEGQTALQPGKRPLFILLDATWSEARKMFRKSPYLDGFPVLSLHPDQLSRYQLRRSKRDDHFCTSEVAALCLELVGDASDTRAGQVLESYLVCSPSAICRPRTSKAPMHRAKLTSGCVSEWAATRETRGMSPLRE